MKQRIFLSFAILFFFSIDANTTQEIFTQIYEQGQWHIGETYSGQGSRLSETPIIRAKLPELLKELKIKTLLDAGCGDFNWLRVTELPIENYIGTDIVPSLIENNRKKYGSDHRTFLCLNVIEDRLPQADAILCRDVLNHLPFQDVKKAIANFKQSGTRYLVVTIQTNIGHNNDLLGAGPWRALNFLLAPFNFPQPQYLIYEGNFEANTGKSLAVWLLEDLLK